MAKSTSKKAANSKDYLLELLEEAELLLVYAAESGIEVEDKVRDAVLKAREENNAGSLTAQTQADLLAALTSLAVKVRPETVESLKLRASCKQARNDVRVYGIIAIIVGCAIVAVSLCTFVSSHVAEKINADVEAANALVSKLRVELGPSPSTNPPAVGPGVAASSPQKTLTNASADYVWFGSNGPPPGVSGKEVISDLQQFAGKMREIDGYARQLNHFVFNSAYDPYGDTRTNWVEMRKKLQLTPGLQVLLSQELTDRAEVYQNVRNFGDNVKEKVTVYYGAIATCILPVLYALLGAGAYLLRLHEDQIKNHTLADGDRHVARFLIAGIGGLVVGQFNNFTQGVTIPPLAIAFLVGYAADLFFNFLETLLQMFKRGPGNTGTQAPPPKP